MAESHNFSRRYSGRKGRVRWSYSGQCHPTCPGPMVPDLKGKHPNPVTLSLSPQTRKSPVQMKGRSSLKQSLQLFILVHTAQRRLNTGQGGHGGSASELHPPPVHKHTQRLTLDTQRDPPASASKALGLKICTTHTCLRSEFYRLIKQALETCFAVRS